MTTPVPGRPTLDAERRAVLHRRVRRIVATTISYNVLEAAVAIGAGAAASSAALLGFGLDSVVEVLSAVAVAWQFSRRDPERWDALTARLVAVAFFLLAAYVTVESVLTLTGVQRVEQSAVGIGIAVLSLVTMPALAWVERRTGRELGSASVVADSRQLLVCMQLSGTVLVGLLANSLLHWQWADSVAALVVAALAVREGHEAWRGEVESPFEVLEELEEDDEHDDDARAGSADGAPVQ
ncbi:cation transporter [Cellulomonas sp. SG140]|uniref:cation transporter n=1 Tax=Cellulomonas sp. SG140 TaxID=2976536 RepID=UPI0021E799BB|nr:cation transporter [Cellulomonas sp. SG140]